MLVTEHYLFFIFFEVPCIINTRVALLPFWGGKKRGKCFCYCWSNGYLTFGNTKYLPKNIDFLFTICVWWKSMEIFPPVVTEETMMQKRTVYSCGNFFSIIFFDFWLPFRFFYVVIKDGNYYEQNIFEGIIVFNFFNFMKKWGIKPYWHDYTQTNRQRRSHIVKCFIEACSKKHHTHRRVLLLLIVNEK